MALPEISNRVSCLDYHLQTTSGTSGPKRELLLALINQDQAFHMVNLYNSFF